MMQRFPVCMKYESVQTKSSNKTRCQKALVTCFYFLNTLLLLFIPLLKKTLLQNKNNPKGKNLIFQFFLPNIDISPPLTQMILQSSTFTNGY